MPDYSRGKIYTIRSRTDDNLIYVGSTIQALSTRFAGHKAKSIKNPDYKIYKTINNNWKDWYIELYETFPCQSKDELNKREGEIIRLIGNLNTQIAGRNQQEYNVDNKEKIKELKHEIYLENKEIWKERNQKWREETADRKKELNKEYREANKEKIKLYQKQYRENKMIKVP